MAGQAFGEVGIGDACGGGAVLRRDGGERALHPRSQEHSALDADEGQLADAVNQTAGLRAWELWRSQVKW